MDLLVSPATPCSAMASQDLAIQNLSVRLGGRQILQNISAHLRMGEMVGLIGPNGSGKTTLLSTLMGLAVPSPGTVHCGGRNMAGLTRRAIARLITLMPQDTRLDYPFPVRDVVAMGRTPYLRRFQPLGPEDQAIIAAAMMQAGIAHLADRAVTLLSGGERQRVLFARAIAQQTPILLLDEATASLDLCHQMELMELARALADQGRLVVASIHDLSLASRYCDRLLLLSGGALAADGTPTQVLTEARLRAHFSLIASIRPCPHHTRGLAILPLASAR